jgi:tetratricopeptide (TPR) repeat protein
MVSTTIVLGVIAVALPALGQTAGFRTADVRADATAPKARVPDKPVSPEMRGDIYMARKMFREAVDAYKEGGMNSAILVNKVGIAYHQMMQLETAKKYYERAVKLNPKYSEAINNLGTIYYWKKSYRRAVSQYKKALQFSPNSASIYSNLGTAFFARKNYDEAMKAYETAMKLDPEVFEHRSSAGTLLQERTVEERAKFHYYQAKLYAKQGMNERALLCLRKALEEGLKERDKIGDEPAFETLRELPEFKEILAWQPRVL